MDYVILFGALAFLIAFAYRGFSVVIFAPLAALLAVLLTNPIAALPAFSTIFMPKVALFFELYFPVFLCGALFGKLMEMSGFAAAIADIVIRRLGTERAVLAAVLLCAILTYGGVPLFVVVFTAYPFAAALFRQGGVPKRLIPACVVLGAFSFTMDTLPGSPQIQNIIPTSFFGTTTWAAPALGVIATVLELAGGVAYLEWRRRCLRAEGYGDSAQESVPIELPRPVKPLVAVTPLFVVALVNWGVMLMIQSSVGATLNASLPGVAAPMSVNVGKSMAIWSVEAGLMASIAFVLLAGSGAIKGRLVEGLRQAVGAALLAVANAASEFGFGAVIAALPGFILIKDSIEQMPGGALVKTALSITVLSGITGSASGGLSIALGSLGDAFAHAAQAAHIPMEVLHRVASMASGGLDTLPHSAGVITLLVVCGLTHRQAYRDIFAITLLKTVAVFVVIALYHLTGIV
ncbi:GntP family permease [Paraburkholderia sediminicola]|uniref:GntP family permease n=1 Tax=Paraburkholderia sediminicola TaxID=458836 RepID=UPI0038BBC915